MPQPRRKGFSLLLPVLLLAQLSVLSPVFAQSPDQPGQDSQGKQEKEIAAILAVFAQTQPNMLIEKVIPSPIDGMYEMNLENGQIIYASADARFFIPGDLYEVMPQGLVNRGEEKRNVMRAKKIADVPESEMIIFSPEGETRATITVFTDVDCPYCRQLHGEVEALNKLGIKVRYLAYPRTGLQTETHFKMISTWCADDPRAMLTSAKRGGGVPESTCDNPIARHYQLGREVGVTGTPALVLEDGQILPGYVPAETLAEYLLGSAPQ